MTADLYERSAPYYDLIYEGVVDYARECDLLEELFRDHAQREVRRILDIGSGTGNHALILADRGYDVVGVDLHPAFVEQARAKARGRTRPPTFLRGDMRRLEVDAPFDALICMFGAFGHLRREDAPETLRGFRARMAEGGVLAFEFWNPAGAQKTRRHWEERSREGLHLVRLASSRLQEGDRTLEIRFKHYLIRGDRVEDVFEERTLLALYPEEEMVSLLEEAGLVPVAMLDWTAKVLEPAEGKPFRILAVARRQA